MITLVEALNYRSLKYIKQPLKPFQVLIGPNGSGKSTFLDVIAFLSDLVTKSLQGAINERADSFLDLVWQRNFREDFQLAVEAEIPLEFRPIDDGSFDTIRYEVAIGFDLPFGNVIIKEEQLLLKKSLANQLVNGFHSDFPKQPVLPPNKTIFTEPNQNIRLIIKRNRTEITGFKTERDFAVDTSQTLERISEVGLQFSMLYFLSLNQNFLKNLPATAWLANLLIEDVKKVVLNNPLMQKPSEFLALEPTGDNLPWIIENLKIRNPEAFQEWLSHVRTALPDIRDIQITIGKDVGDDNTRYLLVEYQNGLLVPSHFVSDGTLRFLALTLLAYLPNFDGIYLLEEPENYIHPQLIEPVFQSLSSLYDAQVLIATQSSTFINFAKPQDLLCFSKTVDGATDIIVGDKHPRLTNWQHEIDLGTLFAAGILS